MPRRKKEIAVVNSSSSIAVPDGWEDRFNKYTAEVNKMEVGGSNARYISLKNGHFTYGEDQLPEPLNVIIVDAVVDNAYYDGPYNPDSPMSPVCFSIGRDPVTMEPHPTSPDPQAENCAECWANQFGSANVGKGKACKNQRRLAVISSDGLDASNIESTDVAFMKLPPTSVPPYTGYVKKIAKVFHRPPFAVITALEMEEGKNSSFVVQPTIIEPINDGDMLDAIENHRIAIEDDIMAPYEIREEAEPAKPRRTPAKKASAKKAPAKKAPAKKAPASKATRRKF